MVFLENHVTKCRGTINFSQRWGCGRLSSTADAVSPRENTPYTRILVYRDLRKRRPRRYDRHPI